ncbi:coagulation factor 5/8 type domain-containingprotein [Purpureocillium lilacinum]|uniref:Coagulation factor 5/8 type domain-containingprotein n=1 Tax=Purpureocillium lilacinum TaxID=33203 RepID=A0A179HKU3_PURLI|nr:coagulation factor 5/8 type domain-containingprotein [Purpureocillium lilacinum]OAQ90492.1 coagulation factor 5/8 type domain-containingprotein [Purpureocillium lilacinum]
MLWSTLFTSVLAGLASALPAPEVPTTSSTWNPRLILYFQTTHDRNGRPISMLPLVKEKGIAMSDLYICSFHVNAGGVIHLNDYPPSDPRFLTLWNETMIMKEAGVRIMGMVGGAASGSFTKETLDGDTATFEHYYGQLRDVIRQFELQGMDLDIEQHMSQEGAYRLIERLHKDFGDDFVITMAPVADSLIGPDSFGDLNYTAIESGLGREIDWYNAQFYSGFGNMSTPDDYLRIIDYGWKPYKVVIGQLTSPANGWPYVPYDQLNATIVTLRDKLHHRIGGIFGWEYFNSLPGGEAKPWEWAQVMTQILRPGMVPKMPISRTLAARLDKAYEESTAHLARIASAASKTVNYLAMVDS